MTSYMLKRNKCSP